MVVKPFKDYRIDFLMSVLSENEIIMSVVCLISVNRSEKPELFVAGRDVLVCVSHAFRRGEIIESTGKEKSGYLYL